MIKGNFPPKHKNYFTPFDELFPEDSLPKNHNSPFGNTLPPICALAVEKLQIYLTEQTDWLHNFGLDQTMTGEIIGKMFGVLVVKTEYNELGLFSRFFG